MITRNPAATRRLATFAKLFALLAAVVVAGCFPVKRLAWSPDGRSCAVLGDDGLHVADDAGHLSPLLVKSAKSVAWLPDSRRAVVARQVEAATWKDAEPYLAAPQREQIEQRARIVRDELMEFDGNWDDFGKQSIALRGVDGGEVIALLMYVRDVMPAGLEARLGPDRWKTAQSITLNLALIEVYDLSDPRGELAPLARLGHAVNGLTDIRISPDGAFAAYVVLEEDSFQGPTPLFVVPIDGSEAPRKVDNKVCWFPDWTPDGRQLAYVRGDDRAACDDCVVVGSLVRRRVRDEAGAPLAQFPDAEELAGLAYTGPTRVRCLDDGRILFTALEMSLPCTARDMPKSPSLFVVDPLRQATVSRAVPRSLDAAVAEGLPWFELSPDGTRVAVLGERGSVRIVTLASAETIDAYEGKEGFKTETLPAWRNAEDLTVAVAEGHAEGAPQRAEFAVAHITIHPGGAMESKLRPFSRTWPAGVMKDMITSEEKKGP